MKPISICKSILPLLVSIALPAGATLPTVPTPAAQPAPSYGAAGLLQAGFGLVVVLALVFLCAWVMRRVGLQRHGTAQVVKVVASTMVGQRERVVVVEVGNEWLVLGVTPGQVRSLHSMPAQDLPPVETIQLSAMAGNAASAASVFSQKLRESLSKARRTD